MRHIIILTVILWSSYASAEQRHAGSHVHGLNHATLVLEGVTLQITYEFPAEQLNEHKHDEHKHDENKHDENKHDEHSAKNHDLSEKLEQIESIFEIVLLPENAQCTETEVSHSLTQFGGSDKEQADHQDALIKSTLECNAPEKLIIFSFEPTFERFDDLEKIEVEGVIGNKALSETLTATSALLAL